MERSMDLRNWRLNIAKTKAMNGSRYIIIPYLMANDMNLEPGDYIYLEYDDVKKEIKMRKN